jgi:DnaK suppressor protein
MDKKDLERFKKKLLKLKNEILMIIQDQENPGNSKEAMDDLDQAAEMVAEQMGSLMSTNFQKNLYRVNAALAKLENNQFGKCVECGQEIPLKRLAILPVAELCVACQTELENDLD